MEEHQVSQPLSGLRVVDLTQGIAGPYCTKLLSDYGADVIKVERPGIGDYARTMGPFPDDAPHPEKSGTFLFLNTNKRGITLDLDSPEGAEAVKEMVKGADVLVESFKSGNNGGIRHRLRRPFEDQPRSDNDIHKQLRADRSLQGLPGLGDHHIRDGRPDARLRAA